MQIFGSEIRFGIHAGQQHTTLDDYVKLWQAAEALGYDWASVFDHFVPIFSDPAGPCFEGPTLLAALAAKTTRVRCGFIVGGVTYRHPAILAKIATTIDHLSGGRLEFGIGAGWHELEHQQYGIPFPTVGQRMQMLAETAKIVKSLWTEPRTTFKGHYYTLTDAYSEPKPIQQPHMPLWIGGASERLTLRIAAESADGWNTFFLPLDIYERKLEALARHCREVRRDPAEIRKALVVQAAVGETEREAQVKAARLAAARQIDPATIREHAIVGTPEQCVDQLRPYVQLGVGDFLISARPPVDLRMLELIAKQIAPAVKAERRSMLSAW